MVSITEAQRFCQSKGLEFMETSALTGINVEEAFNKISQMIMTKIENGELENMQGPQSGLKYERISSERYCTC